MVNYYKTKNLNHPVEKIYSIVADVAKYPEFLPWCTDIKILKKTKKLITAEVYVGFKNINECYKCMVILDPYNKIVLDYISGPFEYLELRWSFKKINKSKSKVIFFTNFKFKSKILGFLTSIFLDNAIKTMVQAFEKKLNST